MSADQFTGLQSNRNPLDDIAGNLFQAAVV